MADKDIDDLVSVILGETSGLTAQGDAATAAAAQERLWADVAVIALKAKASGLLGQMRRAGDSVPADEVDAYRRMREIAQQVFDRSYPKATPAQAALWRLAPDGFPQMLPRKPPTWIVESGASASGDFKDRNGVRYRLFEKDATPPPYACGYVSSYTLTGAAASAWSVPARKRQEAWILGWASALLFLAAGVWAVWSGQTGGADRQSFAEPAVQAKLMQRIADDCIADQALFPALKRSICDFVPTDANGKFQKVELTGATAKAAPVDSDKLARALAKARDCLNTPPLLQVKPPAGAAPDFDAAADDAASCALVGRAGAQSGLVARPAPGTSSLLVQAVALMAGVFGLTVALGLGTKGRPAGIWIDERNRVSLARAQVTLWTIVALGGFAAIALFNAGLGGPIAFPRIPAAIAAALGISFASPILSALILKTKDFGLAGSASDSIARVGRSDPGDSDFSSRSLANATDASPLEIREKPADASLADVFLGELASEAATVDLSRLQNVTLTVTLVLGYLAMIVNQLRAIPPDYLLSGVPALPDPGGAFTAVLLVSHAGYLGTKAYKGASASPPSASG